MTTVATPAAVAKILRPPVSITACLSQGRAALCGCRPTEVGASAAAAAAAASVAAAAAVVAPAPALLHAALAAAGGAQWQLLAYGAAGDAADSGGHGW